MEIAATAEQRKKMKKDKKTEKTRKRDDKEQLQKLQKQDKKDKKKVGQNTMRIVVGDTSTNPISAPDNILRTRTGSSSQKFDI
jgi:hypothetical protein